MEDSASRKRLKKKVLDRWENEGGRLCDDPTKAYERNSPRKGERKAPRPSHDIPAAGNENPPGHNE